MAHFREGPVGRFIPRAGEMPDLRELREAPLRVVAPAVEALEELHRRADEKARTLIGGVLAPLRELAHEVAKLQRRIEELEARIVHRRDRSEAAAAQAATASATTTSEAAASTTASEAAGSEAVASEPAVSEPAVPSEPPPAHDAPADHPATPEP